MCSSVLKFADMVTTLQSHVNFFRDDDDDGVDLNFHITDGGGTERNVDKLNTLTDGVWGHVAVTWLFKTGTSASRLRLYVDGVLQDEQAFTVASGAINSAINTLYFGDNRSASSAEINSANGVMDQVKLYEGELTASEIVAIKNESPSCAPPPPVPRIPVR